MWYLYSHLKKKKKNIKYNIPVSMHVCGCVLYIAPVSSSPLSVHVCIFTSWFIVINASTHKGSCHAHPLNLLPFQTYKCIVNKWLYFTLAGILCLIYKYDGSSVGWKPLKTDRFLMLRPQGPQTNILSSAHAGPMSYQHHSASQIY